MRVLVYLADGFEESEAIIPIDLMRRAGMDVVTSVLNENRVAVSSHQVPVVSDMSLSESEKEEFDILFLPGGMPGSINLSQCFEVNKRAIEMASKGKIVSAICAAPAVVLANAGILEGKKATCYPGCESYSEKKDYLSDGVVVDGNIVTGKSAAYAFDLALKIIEMAEGKEKAEAVSSAIYYTMQ